MITSAGPDVLLVGASGRVGRMVLYHWPQASTGRLVVSHRGAGRVDGRTNIVAVHWSPLAGPADLCDQLSQLASRPKALIMLAGVTPGPDVDESALAVNAQLADACLKAAHRAGIGRVLLASSSAVYGVDPDGAAFDETAIPRPMSPYGRAKLSLEAAADPWRAKGIEVCALRIGNVAGADALLHQLDQGLTQGPLKIDAFADGLGPLRSYIGAKTLTRVLAHLATHAETLPDVLNLASPSPVRMTALAKAANYPYRLTPAPISAHQSITLDCHLLERLIPFTDKDSQATEMVRQWKETLG